MAPRTRSKPAAKEAKAEDVPVETKPALSPEDPHPAKLCILPKDTSPDARIVTLPNPATSSLNRYYFCPEKGIYEFTQIAAPRRATPRSWLVTQQRKAACDIAPKPTVEEGSQPKKEDKAEEESQSSLEDQSPLSTGYITAHADLLVATPVDPLFFLLPALAPTKDGEKQMFFSLDDHLDNLTTSKSHLAHLLRNPQLRTQLESRAASVCDTVDAGEEQMYRISINKLVTELLGKADAIVKNGLPASLEDQFVRKALEAPIMSIRREESNDSSANGSKGEENIPPMSKTSEDSQNTETSNDSQEPIKSKVSVETTSTSVPDAEQPKDDVVKSGMSAPEGVPHLLRLRTALSFMSASYLPPSLRSVLNEALKTTTVVRFAPLDAHLAHLASLRKEAQALRSLSDNVSLKRTFEGDDEAAQARAEKKLKKDEEEKKKKNQSRGVKDLAKADTTGMKKLSSFFMAKPQKKKT